MEICEFRMEFSLFWMQEIKPVVKMEKISLQHGEISVQKLEGEFSILNGENALEEKRKTNFKKDS